MSMTQNLFKSAIVWTDVHLGLKHNSVTHLDDCIDYTYWLIESAKARNIETCIFMGDFMHHRNTVNAQTLEYSIRLLKLLNDNFKNTYFLVGNHDLYLRDSRSITTMKFASLYPNIDLIDTTICKQGVAFVPWLVNDEWKDVQNIKSKYLFGHFELPGFKMNAQIEMPDHGLLNAEHFVNQEYIFSGHFHKRQTKGKITYVGNPFGHNYSDVWDFERGAMVIEWDKEPEFLNYKDGPRYITINLAALLANPDIYLKPKTHLQVTIDIDITYEEASFLRETFLNQYNVREFKLIRNPDEDLTKISTTNAVFKTVDQIVTESLLGIDKDPNEINALIQIYDRL